MPPRDEQRAHPRYAVEIDAEVRIGDELLPARTRDLSRGGLCFSTDRALPVGAPLDLSLALVFDEQTFSEPLALRARVVWCTPLGPSRFQIGTCFVGMTRQNRTFLDMFLRYLAEGLERMGPATSGGEEGDLFG